MKHSNAQLQLNQYDSISLNYLQNKCDAPSLFKLFDVAAVGSINVSNLKKIARELGISVKEEELEEMIKRADVDGDGEVSEKEFIEFMLKTIQFCVCFNKYL